MKTRLKDNIFIKGFDSNEELYSFKDNLCIVSEPLPYIWLGKTSEIPEEIAKEYVKYEIKTTCNYDGFDYAYLEYANYSESLKKEYNLPCWLKTAKESIQSACNQTYCIIYKENNL